MKTFFLTFLLLILTGCVFGQENLHEIDIKVNGVRSGSSYASVIQKVGKPMRTKTEKYKVSEACSNLAETHLTLYYSGLEITLLGNSRGKNLDIYRIEISSKRWLASGVRIGTTSENIIAKFNEPNSKAESSGETVFYYVTKGNLGGVNFYFKGNKLNNPSC